MKRILALLLSLTMLMSLLIVPANAAGEDVVLKITPDKTSINTATAQDVTYTISIEVKDSSVKIGGIQFTLDAPSGMTIPTTLNADNFQINSSELKLVKDEYDNVTGGIFDTFGYTKDTYTFIAVGTTEDRNLHENAEIMKIKVSVAENTTGSLNFTAKNVEFAKVDGGAEKWTYRIDTTPVTITKAPIDSVSAEVKTPTAGQPLDFTGTVASGAPYRITKVEWFEGTDATGTPVTGPATAKAKQFYYARITLTANPGETFAESLDDAISGGIYAVARNSATELYLTKAYPETGDLPAASVTAAPTAKSGLKYDGTKKDLLGFKGNADGGTMQYRLGDSGAFTTDIPMATDAGTYTVYYMVKGDSTHSDYTPTDNTVSVKIEPKDISSATIGTIADQPYTGSAITPNPEVKDGGTVLEKDKDYTVSGTNNKYVGTNTATLTITGKGNYTGTKTANFTITAVNQNPTFTTPVDLTKGGHRLDLRTLVQDAEGDMTFTISGGTSTYAVLDSDGYTLTSTVYPGTVNINVRIAAGDENNDGNNEYNAFNKDNAITVNVVDKTTNTSTMKVSQDNIIYGVTVSPSVTNKPDGTGTVSYTYEGREGTSYNSTTAPTNVGKYKVTATCESSTTIYTAEANFEILPKSISGMTVTLDETTTVYNGITQTVTVTGVGTLTDTDYDVTSGTSGEDVGDYTVTVTGKGNYKDTATATWKITQATPYYTAPTGLTAKYGQTLAAITLPARWSWMDSTQSVGDASTTAKTFKAKFTPADTTNYETVENIEVSVTVGKADAPTLPDIALNQKYNVTTEQSKDIGTAGMPADAGALTYTEGNPAQTTGSVTIDSASLDATTGKVTYKLSNGAVGDTVTLPVTIKSTNYADATVNVVITLIKGSSGGYYYAPTAAVVPDMPMLYRGCTGDAVKTLQDKLNALGYNSGNVDGIFGAKTYAAVTAFQKANSLGVDGIVGKLTWGKLYGVSPAMPVETTTVVGRPMVSYGSRGDAVRKLQELLNALGYDCGSVDGIFGSKTKAAVLAFQKANGLGADGIVGPLTWAKLG